MIEELPDWLQPLARVAAGIDDSDLSRFPVPEDDSGRPSAVKLVARWTGARERTVKNWFAGSCAPKGDHFRELVRHCPEMLDAFLMSVDRQDHLALAKVVQVEAALLEALAAIAKLKR